MASREAGVEPTSERQIRCGACGTGLPPAARFCLQCGAPTAPEAERPQQTAVKAEAPQQMGLTAEGPQQTGAINVDELMVYVWAGLLGLVCLISVVAFLRAAQ